MSNNWPKLLQGDAFNVRVSILKTGCYTCSKEKTEDYLELIKCSLGTDIINSEEVFIGNYSVLISDEEISCRPFQYTGKELVTNLAPAVRKSTAIRINIRMKQGGFKSWVIVQ